MQTPSHTVRHQYDPFLKMAVTLHDVRYSVPWEISGINYTAEHEELRVKDVDQ